MPAASRRVPGTSRVVAGRLCGATWGGPGPGDRPDPPTYRFEADRTATYRFEPDRTGRPTGSGSRPDPVGYRFEEPTGGVSSGPWVAIWKPSPVRPLTRSRITETGA